MHRTLVSLSAILIFTGCATTQAPVVRVERQRGAALPVTRVVLYQNGVGYFEREGQVAGDVLSLQVRSDQVNDLLKSLTVIDAGDGRAVSISLPLEKTGAQQLAELPAQVREAGGLVQVLRVFRGARVSVEGEHGTVAGRVLGVEEVPVATGQGTQVSQWRLTLKTDDDALQVYPIDSITRVFLQDPTLRVGLDKSLDVALGEGAWKPIGLDVHLTGAKPHQLLVSYIVEMPLWKPAYRLVLPKGRDPLLQGWAVVDNVSGEDWKDVKLSLVAGTPMSFIYDLHSPQMIQRVDLTPRHRAVAMAPVVEKSGTTTGTRDMLQRSYASSRAAGPSMAPSPPPPMAERSRRMPKPRASRSGGGASIGDISTSGLLSVPSADSDESEETSREALNLMLEQQAPSQAEGQSVGSLFRYDLTDPVTVPDRSSTLVAIINSRVKGQEIVLFRPELTSSSSKSYPYRAAMFANTSGFTLEKGPVTIYADGTFVGEGFVERLEQGHTAFITFSIDGRVTLQRTMANQEEGAKLLKIQSGMLVSEVLSVQRSVYAIENLHPESITAFVKTNNRGGDWKLRAKPTDTVETADALFLPITVKPGEKTELVEEWTRPIQRRIAIDSSLATSVIKLYLDSGTIPAGVKKPLEQILSLKARMDEISAEESRLEKQRRSHNDDQYRVRQNLNLLRRTRGNKRLQDELVVKLADLERKLGQLSGKLVALSEEKASLTSTMKVLISGITLDAGK